MYSKLARAGNISNRLSLFICLRYLAQMPRATPFCKACYFWFSPVILGDLPRPLFFWQHLTAQHNYELSGRSNKWPSFLLLWPRIHQIGSRGSFDFSVSYQMQMPRATPHYKTSCFSCHSQWPVQAIPFWWYLLIRHKYDLPGGCCKYNTADSNVSFP